MRRRPSLADIGTVQRLAAITLVLLGALAAVGSASAAQLIDRNATGVQIRANAKGEAMITYHKGGAVKHVLVWGAINAIAPREGAHQAKFKLDYSGGWGTRHTVYWKHFPGSCGAYDGPTLPNVVAACTSPGRLVLGRAELAAAPAEPRLHPVAARAARELARDLALDR